MSDELSDRVHRLLTETASSLEKLPDDPEEAIDSVERDGLGNLAAEASELLETTDPEELLSALGLADDETGPGSIPAAIATGDPERVANLRALLKLSALAPPDEDEEERDPEAVDRAVGELRETVGERYDPDGDEGIEADEDGDEGVEADEDGDGEPEDADAAEAETEASDSGSSGEGIESAMRSALSETRDELDGIRDRLGSDDDDGDDDGGLLDRDDEDGFLGGGDDDDGDDGLLDGDGDNGGLLEGDEDDDEDDDDADEEDDDGLVDTDGLTDGDEGMADQDVGSSGGRPYLRTMPRQDRADMRAVRRHSTMPDR